MEPIVGFNIIGKLNSSQHLILQSFQKQTINTEVSHKSLLIGIEYELQISTNHVETLIIFATPLQHQLATHIVFEKKSIIYHIEYNSKQYLISHNHIQYLNNSFTLLDSIEAELFNEISYITYFKKEFELHLPLSPEKSSYINTIQIHHTKGAPNSHLLTPHLSLEHAQHPLISQDIPLNNILANAHFIEKIYEYSNFTYSTTRPTFAHQEIFQVITDDSSTQPHSQNEELTLIEPIVTYYLYVSPNLIVPLVTSQSSSYPLPLFISSHNSFVEISNVNEFRTITGRDFEYSLDLFQSILIKDKYSKYATYANLFLHHEYINLLNFQPSHIYSSPQEYYLKNALSDSSPIFRPMQQPFSIRIGQLIQKLISFIQEKMIQSAQFPKKSINTPLSYFLLYYVSEINYMLHDTKYQDFEVIQRIEDISIQILEVIYKFKLQLKELYELSAVLFSILKLNSSYNLSLNIDESFFQQFDMFKSKEFTQNLFLKGYDIETFEPYFITILELSALYNYLCTTFTICVIEDESYKELLQNTNCEIHLHRIHISQQINLNEFSLLLKTPHLSIYVNN